MLDLLYPPHCVACGKLGAWFCMGCVETTPVPEPPLCRHCGKPWVRAGLCDDCRQSRSYLAGMRSVAWDGRDDGGQALPPGVYLATLRTAGALVGTRVTLLR